MERERGRRGEREEDDMGERDMQTAHSQLSKQYLYV